MPKQYRIALNVRVLKKNELYTAGATISDGNSKELERVASLFISAESKRRAVMNAIEALLNEVEEGSRVIFYGRQIGRPVRESLKASILETIAAKRLYLSMSHSELEGELETLYELAQDGADRESSIIAAI